MTAVTATALREYGQDRKRRQRGQRAVSLPAARPQAPGGWPISVDRSHQRGLAKSNGHRRECQGTSSAPQELAAESGVCEACPTVGLQGFPFPARCRLVEMRTRAWIVIRGACGQMHVPILSWPASVAGCTHGVASSPRRSRPYRCCLSRAGGSRGSTGATCRPIEGVPSCRGTKSLVRGTETQYACLWL